MPARQVTGRVLIDTRDFRDVAAACRKAGGATRREFRKSLVAAGDIVRDEARAIVSPYSRSIPPTIKTQVRDVSVKIVAGTPDKPLALLFEFGNKDRPDSATTWRHPVFGTRGNPSTVWVEQAKHPFLMKAAENKEEQVGAAVVAALERVSKIAVRRVR